MFTRGRKDSTRFLFDAYATAVFRLVPDAETFIGLLGPIGERVKSKLSVIDQHEAELCRLQWVKLAWERAKPTVIGRARMRLQALWRSRPAKSASPFRKADRRNLEPSTSAPKTVDVASMPNAARKNRGEDTIDQAGGTAGILDAASKQAPEWEDVEISFIGDHDAEVRLPNTQPRKVS